MLLEVLGWAGSIEIAAALIVACLGALPATSRTFRALNVSGSVLIGLNSAAHHAFASVFANIVVIASIVYIEIVRSRM
jgi:hypothetical protein